MTEKFIAEWINLQKCQTVKLERCSPSRFLSNPLNLRLVGAAVLQQGPELLTDL